MESPTEVQSRFSKLLTLMLKRRIVKAEDERFYAIREVNTIGQVLIVDFRRDNKEIDWPLQDVGRFDQQWCDPDSLEFT